jgi:aminoglycoside phosphotransferase (APT) family kinase protein
MVESKLLAYLKGQFPDREKLHIQHFREIGEGWETRISGFTLEYVSQGKKVRQGNVIRMYPGNHGAHNAEREFHVLRTLNELEYPTPRVHLVEVDANYVGMPFILMDLIRGSTMGQLLASNSPEKQHTLYNQFGELFVRLHQLDWNPFIRDFSAIKPEDPYFYIHNTLSHSEKALKRFRLEELLPILEWLQTRVRQVPCPQLSFTHGDFHPFNIMIDSKGAPFVIDWTAAKIADFRTDLAWTMLLTGTFNGPEARDQILHLYENTSGSKIEEIEYFEVLAILRRLFDFLVSVKSESSPTSMRKDIAAIMSQQSLHYQKVYALLQERTDITIPSVEKLIQGLS